MYPTCLSGRAKAFDVHRTVRFLVAAIVCSRGAAEPPSIGANAAPCVASLRIVRLLVVNEAGVEPASLNAAAVEASEIWAGAGVRLEWTFEPTSFERLGGDTVVVVIRRALRTPPSSDRSEPSASHALGRINFAADGRPANLIEVSLDAVTGLVMAGSAFDRPIPLLPPVNRWAIVGRGLGRVVAHELGHWLAGRAHVRFGVMKSGFDTRDLVEAITPLLPPAWRTLVGGAVPAGGRRGRAGPGNGWERTGREGCPEKPDAATGGTGR